MIGINVDPDNVGGKPEPKLLRRLGFASVRLVSKQSDAVWSYVDQCHAADLRVLAAIAAESGGYMLGGKADIYQFGNEPDSSGASSWTMSPQEYIEQFNLYQAVYPSFTWIAAGLASGQVSYWEQVAPHLNNCVGVAVHPYDKSAEQARTLLQAYKAVRPDLALFVTEWHRPPNEMTAFSRMLREEAEHAFWFCHSDAMVSPFGLVDQWGNPKPELHRAKAAAV